ncbi:MAG: type II toxin-antitoxin system RelE/ParE family toxin, partial [Chloroflexi bacterium]|nr:type II toxin-antitoxin system RelE/ParE family toxin [Chloroflexota bacterium]
MKVVHYITSEGIDYFDRWMRRQTPQLRARIQTRIDRVKLGNFGDYRSLGAGVYELRLKFGAGNRIYNGRDGDDVVVLIV